ncbi:MAG: hypothetical protein AB7G93_00055 [Bdellovibrionales bacterium]
MSRWFCALFVLVALSVLSVFASAALPSLRVQSTYLDERSGREKTIEGHGALVDVFGTPVVVTSSHLTQGGLIQGRLKNLKVIYRRDGQTTELPTQVRVADNLIDVALLFSEAAFGLPVMAKARYLGPEKIQAPYMLSLVHAKVTANPALLEFPLVGAYRDHFLQNTNQLLRTHFPLGQSTFIDCPGRNASFCADNQIRLEHLKRLHLLAGQQGSSFLQRVFGDGFYPGEGEGIVFHRLPPGTSGQPVVHLKSGEPQLLGLVSSSSLNTSESWFTFLNQIAPILAELPSTLEQGRVAGEYRLHEFYLRYGTLWRLEGDYLARVMPSDGLGKSYVESRPVETETGMGTAPAAKPRQGLGNGIRADNGNGIRADNGDGPAAEEADQRQRSLPLESDVDGKNRETIYGFSLFCTDSDRWSGLLPPTIGGLRRYIVARYEDVSRSRAVLPPRHSYQPFTPQVVRRELVSRLGPPSPFGWIMRQKVDRIDFATMETAHGEATVQILLLESSTDAFALKVSLDFLDDQVGVTLRKGEALKGTATGPQSELRPYVDVVSKRGRQCDLETGGLVFESPDRLNAKDPHLASLFVLVCGSEHFYFSRPRPPSQRRPQPASGGSA